MKYITLFLFILFISCVEKKEIKKFIPNPTYSKNVYIKPDSTIVDIKWFGAMVGKDTTYYYGIEYNTGDSICRKIIKDEDIFGKIVK